MVGQLSHPGRSAALGAQSKSRGSSRQRRGGCRRRNRYPVEGPARRRCPRIAISSSCSRAPPDSDGILRLHFARLTAYTPLRMTDVLSVCLLPNHRPQVTSPADRLASTSRGLDLRSALPFPSRRLDGKNRRFPSDRAVRPFHRAGVLLEE